MEIKCPYCHKNQEQDPIKSWAYGKMLEKKTKNGTKFGSPVNCARYSCVCGKAFNFFLTTKGKNWTIPKMKEIIK